MIDRRAAGRQALGYVQSSHPVRPARLAPVVPGSVPLAVVGALATPWQPAIPFSAFLLLGGVLLVGLVAKNGLLLLEQYEHPLAEGQTVAQALLLAGPSRARLILMTTVANLAGLTPVALDLGAGAEMQRRLPVAVVGGLLVLTAVRRLVLPSLARVTSARGGPSPASR